MTLQLISVARNTNPIALAIAEALASAPPAARIQAAIVEALASQPVVGA